MMRWVPSPFVLALILTLLSILLIFLIQPSPKPEISQQLHNPDNPLRVLEFWRMGVWELLAFTMQMALILVLGHCLALSQPFKKAISFITQFCVKPETSAALVAFFSILTASFNWGLGLIFGALLAREVGKHLAERGEKFNYALLGAAGYSGLMVWHGGLSGSAPLTVSNPGHFLESSIGLIPSSETLFSTMNIVVFGLCLFLVPLGLYFLSKKLKNQNVLHDGLSIQNETEEEGQSIPQNERLIASLFGLFILAAAFLSGGGLSSQFLSLDNINLILFGLAILAHGGVKQFLKSAEIAVKGSTGIILQFPLYAGIMGLMKYSGLLEHISLGFVDLAQNLGNPDDSFPFVTFCSAGLVNFFVPSGGGQWAVQGPIVVQAASELQVPIGKSIMALAYGDQLTNMIQPFWALPLLSITGLKAKQILPYSFLVMLVGALIFGTAIFLL